MIRYDRISWYIMISITISRCGVYLWTFSNVINCYNSSHLEEEEKIERKNNNWIVWKPFRFYLVRFVQQFKYFNLLIMVGRFYSILCIEAITQRARNVFCMVICNFFVDDLHFFQHGLRISCYDWDFLNFFLQYYKTETLVLVQSKD